MMRKVLCRGPVHPVALSEKTFRFGILLEFSDLTRSTLIPRYIRSLLSDSLPDFYHHLPFVIMYLDLMSEKSADLISRH